MLYAEPEGDRRRFLIARCYNRVRDVGVQALACGWLFDPEPMATVAFNSRSSVAVGSGLNNESAQPEG